MYIYSYIYACIYVYICYYALFLYIAKAGALDISTYGKHIEYSYQAPNTFIIAVQLHAPTPSYHSTIQIPPLRICNRTHTNTLANYLGVRKYRQRQKEYK